MRRERLIKLTALPLALFAAGYLALGAGVACAQENAQENSGSKGRGPSAVDHEKARAAVQSGEIMPLHEILTIISKRFDGRVIDVSLESLGDGLYGWVYDIHLYASDDTILMLRVDAGTASVLDVVGEDGVGLIGNGDGNEK